VATGDCIERASHRCSPVNINSSSSSNITPNSAAFGRSDASGTAASSGGVDAASYLPQLHAYAQSNAAYTHANNGSVIVPPRITDATGMIAAYADSNIWGVQGYRYTGVVGFDLTVTGTLDSLFSASGQQDLFGHSSFSISIFDAAGYAFSYDLTDAAGQNTTICAILNHTFSPTCPTTATIYDAAGAFLYDTGSTTVTVHHWVNPGDEFFVGAFLDANVNSGITVDSSHTLRLAFNDFTQLESVDVPIHVPEPETFALMGLGLFGLAATRNRKQRGQLSERTFTRSP
jgi:hypothetical protein